ncbi:MAG: tyrosine-type recombinase/integrase, partial [Clostridia bacterium]|nr:tyrosine-type recombinase/integrase [Clostridia bacterium]
MDTIAIINPQEMATAQEFNPSLINDFIAWIDRSEKTTRSYLTNLKQFITWLRYAAITTPQRNDIISYRQWLIVEHDAITLDNNSVTGWKYRTDATGNPIKINCKANTVAQYLRSVCQFFRWTAANNYYPDIAANIHAPKIKHDTHKKGALTAKEVLTIEESITERAAERQQAAQEAQKDTAGRMQRSTEQGKRLYAMYLLAVNAGLRTIEINRANIKDLETKGGQTWLYIWGKGHTEPDQRKPLAPEVAAAIKDYLQSRTDRPTSAAPLFVSTGNRSGGKRIATTTISTMLKRAMQEAGFDSERLTAHSLRHSAAQAALQASGDNIYTAQKYLRHSSPATTEIYLHEDERTEKAEAN